ncbi:U3 small nucleolar RNA-associated protein 15 [Sphaceloma murrayae]|uniref:U3 small nucleolar RNA-associated protein 15 n=1 Tax=Sphaceloma murrayae TaxID=2082308 RepID=A0A2K1QQ96_9PEZI|nr:U3 small nucleolar RNA-associated protein 15 [Sphaceloma murrayae]
MAPDLDRALALIDAAHSEDPNQTLPPGTTDVVPYELHYARKMSSYLTKLSPTASTNLQIAIRAQHFRRWEVPRSSYPMTKIGYHQWRGFLKKRQAELVSQLLADCGFEEEDRSRVEALIRKEGLREGDEEAQTLEDVACLVFLDDQFEEFREKHDEGKIVDILRKTWVKMSKRGQDMALDMRMDEESRRLVEKAIS